MSALFCGAYFVSDILDNIITWGGGQDKCPIHERKRLSIILLWVSADTLISLASVVSTAVDFYLGKLRFYYNQRAYICLAKRNALRSWRAANREALDTSFKEQVKNKLRLTVLLEKGKLGHEVEWKKDSDLVQRSDNVVINSAIMPSEMQLEENFTVETINDENLEEISASIKD